MNVKNGLIFAVLVAWLWLCVQVPALMILSAIAFVVLLVWSVVASGSSGS